MKRPRIKVAEYSWLCQSISSSRTKAVQNSAVLIFIKLYLGGGGGLNVDNFHILKILLVLVKKSSS